MPSDDGKTDFSWIAFVGVTLLGYTEHEVGRMTLRKWSKLYKHYKDVYDFQSLNANGQTTRLTYRRLEEMQQEDEEWF